MKKNFIFLLFLSFYCFGKCFASDAWKKREDEINREIDDFEREEREDVGLFESKLKEADKKESLFEKNISLVEAYLFFIKSYYSPSDIDKLQSCLKNAFDECQTENDNDQKQKKLEIYHKVKDQSDNMSLIYQQFRRKPIAASGMYPLRMVYQWVLRRMLSEQKI